MDFFVNGDWSYVNERIYEATNRMTAEERMEFNCETKLIEWDDYSRNYIKGMAIWSLFEDQVSPEHGLDQILLKNYNRFDNAKESLRPRLNFIDKSTEVYEKQILNQERFYDFL